jgi:altered-inheritance-of-mitochondria protein 5
MNAVRWVQRTDWVQVREGLEDSASRLLGYTVNGSSEVAEKKVEPALTEGVVKVAAAATGAFEQAREKGKEVITAAIENGKEVVQNLEGGAQPTLSPVQMALNQRYEKPSVQVHQTVEQALAERYKPVEKRDTSLLRGV